MGQFRYFILALVIAASSFAGGIKVDSIVARGDTLVVVGNVSFRDSILVSGNNVLGLLDNVAYTDRDQLFSGYDTFFLDVVFQNRIIGSGDVGLSIETNTEDGADNKRIRIGRGVPSRGGYIAVYDNEAYRGGDVRLVAGDGSGGVAGRVCLEGNANVSGDQTIEGLTASQIVETNADKKLVSAAKGTAYNKSFGDGAGEVCEGNDARLSDDRAPLAHSHLSTELPSNVVYTDNTQTIAGAKTFTQGVAFNSGVIDGNDGGMFINTNSVDGSDTKIVSLFGAGGNTNRAGGLVAYGNESNGHGDLRLYAGEGSNGVTGAIVANSKLLTKKAIASEQGTGLYTYKDVLHFNTSPPAINYTGTCKITMPVSWTSTMLQIKISGYDYGGLGAWECVVSGYNHSGGPSWLYGSAEIRGQAPFSTVRLAHDGTKCVLLLGNTSTAWHYPQIAITDVIAGYSNQDAWGSGWGLSFITSESGIGSIVTPSVQSMARSDHDHDGIYADVETGTFTATLSGVDPAITETAKYCRVGDQVTIRIPAMEGMSNSQKLSIKGIPDGLRPRYISDVFIGNFTSKQDNVSSYKPLRYKGGDSLSADELYTIGTNKGIAAEFYVTYLIED